MRHERNHPRLGHLSERFALLMLIVSGEGFFKLVLTLTEKGITHTSPPILFNYILGAVCVFGLCWIYYDLAANAKPKDSSNKTVYIWTFAHMMLMLGTVMCGVALVGEVKVGFFEPYPLKYAAVGCAGFILYLISLTVIQYHIEKRMAHRFTLGWIRWFGIALTVLTFFVIPYIPAIVGNLLWGGAIFSQILIPIWQGRKALNAENDF